MSSPAATAAPAIPELAPPADPAALIRAEFRAAKAAVLERFQQNGKVDSLTRALARVADRTLISAWRACDLPTSLVLAAVGGFGRTELAPHSDIDILILLPAEPDAALESRLERFIGMAWDLGLEIGSSVRTVDQCDPAGAHGIAMGTAAARHRGIQCAIQKRDV